MNTEAVKRIASSPPAERMRRYRKRRPEGLQLVRIPLHVTEIDKLIIGTLDEQRRQNPEALQAAVLRLVYRALDGIRDTGRGARTRSPYRARYV